MCAGVHLVDGLAGEFQAWVFHLREARLWTMISQFQVIPRAAITAARLIVTRDRRCQLT